MNTRNVGQPPVPWSDILKALCFATFFNKASRKANAWGRPSPNLFLRGKPPSVSRLRQAMNDPRLTILLQCLIRIVSDCVRQLETRFAIESSYYKTPLYELQVQKRGKGEVPIEKVKNAKLLISIGLQTLMVVGATITDGTANDSATFMSVWKQFCRRFRVDTVIADAAYDNAAHYEEVAACGGKAYFDQRSNTAGVDAEYPHHNEMVRLRTLHFDEWFDVYRFRSLVECVNSIMKRTIKRVIRARKETSRNNELLLVCLVYNLKRLAEARIKSGVDIPWASEEALRFIDAIGEIK